MGGGGGGGEGGAGGIGGGGGGVEKNAAYVRTEQLVNLCYIIVSVKVANWHGLQINSSSLVLLSLFLIFASKVTNIIALIYRLLLLSYRTLSW